MTPLIRIFQRLLSPLFEIFQPGNRTLYCSLPKPQSPASPPPLLASHLTFQNTGQTVCSVGNTLASPTPALASRLAPSCPHICCGFPTDRLPGAGTARYTVSPPHRSPFSSSPTPASWKEAAVGLQVPACLGVEVDAGTRVRPRRLASR